MGRSSLPVAATVVLGSLAQISCSASAQAPPVRALFDLASPDTGPFPSNAFTVADASQLTGLRVNVPKPDCLQRPSDCEDIAVLNTFDGFNMQPRLSVPFSGAIDVKTVTSKTVFLVRLGDALENAGRDRDRPVIGINRIVLDTSANTLHAMTDAGLDEHTRYALIVTRGLRDGSGAPIEPTDAFRRSLRTARTGDLLGGLAEAAQRAGVGVADIAVASVFTTQTFSHVITRMRDAIRRAPAPRADFAVGPDGARAVFDAAQMQTLANNAETLAGGPLTAQPLAQQLANIRAIPGAVGTVAFGKFRALDFTTHPSGHVVPIATRTGTLAATGSLDVAFNLWLPSGPVPAGGWPVAICAHGASLTKNFCFSSASVLASHHLAVIAISAMGHGSGPRTTMTVGLANGTSMTFASPGLGYDADGDGAIGAWEPQRAARPQSVLNTSGTIMQSAALQLQLVRAIQAGVDVDGDGRPDLNGARIYYYSHSLGGSHGVLAFAYEPAIRAAVFVVPAGTLIYNTALAPSFRPGLGEMLAARVPSLLNSAHGLASVDGVATAEPRFNENQPLRDQPPRIDDIPGATDIQRVMDRIAWAAQIGSTVAAAPHLRRAPPAGVAARPFVFQFARSDVASTNPSNSELIRAGGFADRVLFYRHDLNFGNEGVPPGAHPYVAQIAAAPNYARIALGAQHQIGTFFESDGATVIHPAPVELWEAPMRSPLPEDLFFLPRIR